MEKLDLSNRSVARTPSEVLDRLDHAFNQKDIDAVLDFYEDQATMVVEPGRLATGKQEIRLAFEAIISSDGIARTERVSIIQAGDIALYTSKWKFIQKDLAGNEIVKTNFATSILRSQHDGTWKLAIDNAFGPAILN